MLKKIGIAMLCIVMLFSFSACGNLIDWQSKIADLESKIEGLESDNATLSGGVDSLKKDNKDLTDAVGELSEENQALADAIGGLEGTIGELEKIIRLQLLFKVDVFIYNFDDVYQHIFMGVLETKLRDVKFLEFYNGQNSQPTQNSQIENVIEKGSDLLIINLVNATDTSNCTNLINLAKDADIPVIFFHRQLSDEVLNTYDKAAFVGTSVAEVGYTQGQMIAEYLLKPENIDNEGNSKFADVSGNINYIMLKGEDFHPEANFRTLYSVVNAQRLLTAAGKSWTLVASDLNAISSFDYSTLVNEFGELYTADEIEILSKVINADWDPSTAYTKVNNISSHFGDKTKIGIIIANNDDMALGAVQALNNYSYNTGFGDFIPVFGIDGTDDAITAVFEGKLQGTIAWDLMTQVAVISHLISNLKTEKDIMAGTSIYNVSEFANKIYVPYIIVLRET